jgi:hypothetical protein
MSAKHSAANTTKPPTSHVGTFDPPCAFRMGRASAGGFLSTSGRSVCSTAFGSTARLAAMTRALLCAKRRTCIELTGPTPRTRGRAAARAAATPERPPVRPASVRTDLEVEDGRTSTRLGVAFAPATEAGSAAEAGCSSGTGCEAE